MPFLKLPFRDLEYQAATAGFVLHFKRIMDGKFDIFFY